MRDLGVFNIKRAMPRMSWDVKNLYNLYQRTMGRKKQDISFTRTSATLFQQRWVCKAVVRAYHGDFIPEKIFKRYYLPDTLPDVRPRRTVLANDTKNLEAFALRKAKEERYQKEQDRRGMAPVGSLMFSEVERRIDVFIFRSCFAHSVYEARRLVIHGDVLLNGKKHQNANTRLAPGDMVHVNPQAIRFIKPPASVSTSDAPPEVATTPDAKPFVSLHGQDTSGMTHFALPSYASPWLFVPAYIEPNYNTCTAIYVRHPTARPGYSEIPTPYDADGEVVRFAWEWYAKTRPRLRSKRQLERAPEDRAIASMEQKPDWRGQTKLQASMRKLRGLRG